MLTKQQDLAIAVLVYFLLALPVAVLVCKRQGFGRQAGWFYLLTLTIVRIVGSCLEIAAVSQNSKNLYIAAGVFNSIGFVPLLLTLNSLASRVHEGLESGKLPPRLFRLIHLVTLVALILGIVAGSQTGATDQKTINDTKSERKAAAILLIISAIVNSALVLLFVSRLRRVYYGDRKLAILAALSTPFILVRVIYLVLLAFSTDPKFNVKSPNIYVQAFMQSLMEFIIFAIFATAGFMSDRIQPKGTHAGPGQQVGGDGHQSGPHHTSQPQVSSTEGRY